MTDDLPRLDPGAMDRLLEMTGGDGAFIVDLVTTYLEDGVRLLGEMRAAAGAVSGSAEAMVRPAHSLKSNSASVGALRLAEMARSLEAAARSGVVDDAVGRVAAAEAEFEAVASELRASGDEAAGA